MDNLQPRDQALFLQDISQTPAFGKGVRVFEVYPETINDLYHKGYVDLDEDTPVYPNQPLILRAGQQSALAYVSRSGDQILCVDPEVSYFKIKGRNKEQTLLLNLFQDPDIRLVVVTGAAGTGKTVCIGGYALHQLFRVGDYRKLTMSKPLEIVTRSKYWGTVPGGENEKFAPFLKSYSILFEGLIGERGKAYVETAMQQGTIDFMPVELMRGVSLKNSIVWYDEAQNLNHHEMETLGSRIDDVGGSKLILSGDLNQQDGRITESQTGLYRLLSSSHFLNSPHTAHVHLVQNERGVISQLFFDVFNTSD